MAATSGRRLIAPGTARSTFEDVQIISGTLVYLQQEYSKKFALCAQGYHVEKNDCREVLDPAPALAL